MSLEIQAEMLRLHHVEGWRIGTIAAQLNVHHSAVRRVLTRSGVQAPVRRPMKVEPYLGLIRETLEKYPTLRATRLLEIVQQRGYTGQLSRLREVVAELRRCGNTEAYLRLSTLPGEQCQVDWADFGAYEAGRARRRLMAFVMVLSWSRAVFVGFFYDARMPSFLAGHVVRGLRAGPRRGIETREELQIVHSLGADLGQGYFLARPAFEPAPLSIDARAYFQPTSSPSQ